jgi:hypothetical protein
MTTSFLDAAQSEFDDAIDYYDEQQPGLGSEFAEEVGDALERINHYPEAWSPLSPASAALRNQSVSLQGPV